MSINITWNITDLDCLAVAPGTTNPNCVYDIHWECIGTSTEINPVTNQPYNSRAYGVTRLKYVAGVPYTPYESLTREQVLTWTHNVLNQNEELPVSQIEAGVFQSVQRQITPELIKPALPWASA